MADREPEPIAVIGIGCRFPGGANSPETLWSMLTEAVDAWSDVPQNRFAWKSFYDPSPEKQGCMNHRGGHFLQQDVSTFDADFFGISPAEARSIDPQQRILLETTYESIESAGISLEDFKGSDTSVYAATFSNDYDTMLSKDMDDLTPYHLLGTGNATFSNRISHVFDLTGPSITIDTGCSGSLVAIHQACQSLRARESTLALAGGAVIILNPDHMISISPQRILNDNGRCYSFDSRGTGYGRGEGAGILLLKRLDDAIQHGNKIRAVIRASALNQDGKTNGLVFPSQTAQERLARKAFRELNFSPADVHYVEAHATGTLAGDRAEVGAIHNVYCKDRKSELPLIVGSIKANIGHLEAASGVAGVIKTIMCMENGLVPPNLLFEEAKKDLFLTEKGIRIPTVLNAWPATYGPKRAVVNNFGFGGTNAMVVLESSPNSTTSETYTSNSEDEAVPSEQGLYLFQFSAKSKDSLSGYLKDMTAWLLKNASLEPRTIARALATRSLFQNRQAIVASSTADLIKTLTNATSPISKSRQCRNVFVFTGQGAQWPGMGCELQQHPVFAQSIQRSSAILSRLGSPWNLEVEMAKHPKISSIHDSEIAQPATTALQIALTDLLQHWNVTASAVVGHSSGEICAAYAAQIISHESALEIAYHRGSLPRLARERTNIPGAMLAVRLSASDVQLRLSSLELSNEAFVACINGPSSTTVSGETNAISRLEAAFKADGFFARRLKVSTAYHSPHMAAVGEEYRASLSDIHVNHREPVVPYYSTVTTQNESRLESPGYWIKNLVSPVLFSATIINLVRDFAHIEHLNFVEIGPHSVLGGPVRQIFSEAIPSRSPSWTYIPSLIRWDDGNRVLLKGAATLFENGCNPKPYTYDKELRACSTVELPAYHWDRKTFWHEPRLSRDYRLRKYPPHELCGLRILTSPEDEPTWRALIGQNALPWLSEHIIDDFACFPATAYLAMAMEALKQWKRYRGMGHSFEDVRFKRALQIPAASSRVELVMRIRDLENGWANFRVWSISDNQWHEHCKGRIKLFSLPKSPDVPQEREQKHGLQTLRIKFQDVKDSCIEHIQHKTLYEILSERGNNYGSSFSSITDAFVSRSNAYVKITVPEFARDGIVMPIRSYHLHPAIFDAFFQILVYLFARSQSAYGIMLTSLGAVHLEPTIQTAPGKTFELCCELRDVSKSAARFDIIALQADDHGCLQPVMQCWGGELRATGDQPSTFPSDFHNTTFLMKWDFEVHSLTSRDFESIERTAVMEVQKQERKLHRILAAADRFISQALEEVKVLNCVPLEGCLALAHGSMTRGTSPFLSQNKTDTTIPTMEELLELGVEGEVLSRVGPVLGNIFAGKTDALSVLLDDQLLYRMYQDDSTTRCNSYLIEYLRYLTFKYPNMRILEIGAGTGGSTLPVLQSLSPEGQSFCDRYDFTDISSGFFDQAKETLSRWLASINFRTLNVEEDPSLQGFQYNSYDLVIASNVIHATRDIHTALGNIDKLLKPGGTLAFIELIKTNSMYNMTAGLLPGWWSGLDDGRVNSPLLSIDHWSNELSRAYFSSPTIQAIDFPGPAERAAFMVSHARINMAPNGYHTYPAKILHALDPGHLDSSFVDSLSSQLLERGFSPSYTQWDEAIDATCTYVVIDSSEQPFLNNASFNQFGHLTNLIKNEVTMFWVTLSKESSFGHTGDGLITGFARTARSEHESLRLVTIDAQESATSDGEHISVLVADIVSGSIHSSPIIDQSETEYRIRQGRLQIPRIVREPALDVITGSAMEQQLELQVPFHSTEHNLQLQAPTQSGSSLFTFSETSKPIQVNLDDIEIEIYAWDFDAKRARLNTNQNFADQNPITACAGFVTNVGDNFKSTFEIGDRVCAFTTTALANRVAIHGTFVHKIPNSMTYTTGAHAPLIFLQAYHSLVEIARLTANQKVLVHEGDSVLGQAVIQVAQYLGAEIFATVRPNSDLAAGFGIAKDHVFQTNIDDSKESIFQAMQGEGVDVIVNLTHLPSSALLECVAELGVYIQIDDHQPTDNHERPVEAIRRNITFSSVDIGLLMRRRPQTVHRAMNAVFDWLEKGNIRPIPVLIYSISQLQDAVRMIQEKPDTSKIVIEAPKEALVSTRFRPLTLDRSATYIVVGGLGKLGRQINDHLSELGAGHIVLITRRSLPADEKRKLEIALGSRDTQVHILNCDISLPQDVARLSEFLAAHLPPVKGIIQASMILQDRRLSEMTMDDFLAATTPKYLGTRNLIDLFQSTELDFFVSLSSLSGIIGLPGQANYAAGNTYQDQLVQSRLCDKWKRFVSLDLPLLVDTHLLSKEEQPRLTRRGIRPISNKVLFRYLDYSMAPKSPNHATQSRSLTTCVSEQVIFGLDMDAASEQNREMYARNPLFIHVFATQGQKQEPATVETIDKSAAERIISGALETSDDPQLLASSAIQEKISSLVAMSYDDVGCATPIVNLGLDSLIAIELKNWISKIFGTRIQTSDILDSTGITHLVKTILQRLDQKHESTEPQAEEHWRPLEVDHHTTTGYSPKLLQTVHMEVPQQPLPALDMTLDNFYRSVSALGSDIDLSDTRKAIDEFKRADGIGSKLQDRLVKLAQDKGVASWMYENYNDTFWLRRRAPLRPSMNFFSSHILTDMRFTQAEKAAVISLAAFEFKQKLDNGQVPQDFFNDEPQCMESINWIFNAYRRPGAGRDETLRFPGNDYIAVMCHGHVYKVSLVHEGVTVSFEQLKAVFDSIGATPLNEVSWASLMTADERNSWAKARDQAIELDIQNEELFTMMEKSLFVVCLDDASPEDSDTRVQSFLFDDNSNRWNDKTLSFIVCRNGASAFWCEHSMIDGTTIIQLNHAITNAITAHNPSPIILAEETSEEISKGHEYTYYPFISSPTLSTHLTTLHKTYQSIIKLSSFFVLNHPTFGERYLRQHNLSPKGVLEAIISLAVRQHFGYSPAAYEAVSLRSFRLGRLDIYQTHTPEMEAFVSAMTNNTSSDPAHTLELLRATVHAHATGIANTSRGRGWDRHLAALRAVLEPDEQEPALFQDPLFVKTRPRKVFVSFGGNGVPEWGSVWRDVEAVWIGVEVFENG
ncbi:hypothetical protein EJ04DRAFT_604239 [Polyplosphaeria fusca]|uniref:Polyketide synthase n=1 Tax=Polyplosphaeria fusca TaxID=682080 RepID=A0A9P4V286_9PLEO|nr:hypothetical protein EJ04DRAFT_604239 [Polyplosphaeria fusca]